MQRLIYTLALSILLFSCGGNSSYEDKDSLLDLKEELISEFGDDAYYTNLAIMNSENGTVINVSQTDDPSSLKMSEWNYFNGDWNQNSEITLEISGDTKAEDFMFQLNDKVVDFEILGKAVEEAKEKIISEKKIEEVRVASILINAPKDGDFNSMEYYITINPKSGGTRFDFRYGMDGTLKDFDY